MDPYKVLGIMPHSSEKEVKEAYSKIVETYNPSDLEDDSVKSFYEEKLNEANEAYRIIHHNMTCEEVRDLIEKDDFIFAEMDKYFLPYIYPTSLLLAFFLMLTGYFGSSFLLKRKINKIALTEALKNRE